MHVLASFALRYRTDFGKTQPPNRGSMEAASLLLDGFAKGVQLDTLLFARDSMDGGDPLVWRRDDAVSKLEALMSTASNAVALQQQLVRGHGGARSVAGAHDGHQPCAEGEGHLLAI